MKMTIVIVGFVLLATWFGVTVRFLNEAWDMSRGHAAALAGAWMAISIAYVIWHETTRRRKIRDAKNAREFRA